MVKHHWQENERLPGMATRRFAQQAAGDFPAGDKPGEIRFTMDYLALKGDILSCKGRPVSAGGLWPHGSLANHNNLILKQAFAAWCAEDTILPPEHLLAGVSFSRAYKTRKMQILRARGRPANVSVVHSKHVRRLVRVGVVAALLSAIAITSVFSNPNAERNMAGFNIDIDSYFGTIDAPTNPDGSERQDPAEVYIRQPDGTRRLPERYEPTYIPADYALETHRDDSDIYYLFRKDNAFLIWSGDYITFSQSYPGGTQVFSLENNTLEEITVEGLGKCLYHASKKENRRSLTWRSGPYIFKVAVSDMPKDELIKIAKSTKLRQN